MDLPCGTYNTDYKKDMAIVRTPLQWGLLIVFLIFLFTLPLLLSERLTSIVIMIGITLIAVMGLNILTGYCGQISLGQAAFVTVGGYATANFAGTLGLPFWIALPCSGIVAGVIGLFFGLPSLRVKGFYLALATLAAQFIITYCAFHIHPLTGGYAGMHVPAPELGGMVFDTDRSYYYIVIVCALLTIFAAKNLVRTRVGRAFIAIRDNDIAAEVMGVNLYYYKLLAFFISAFFAGIAGSLFAHYFSFMHPESFGLMDSVWYLGMVIIGGMGSIMGAVFGTVLIRLLDEVVHMWIAPSLASTFTNIPPEYFMALSPLLFAVVLIVFLIYEPRGVNHKWQTFKASYRLWPFAHWHI